MAKRGGLGRNLSVLLGHTDKATQGTNDTNLYTTLPIRRLQPGKYQPRRDMEEGALSELAESIKKQGVLQPLLVREIAVDRYEIIAGERRWRACQLAGLSDVPVMLRQVDNETAMAMALVENLQREDLNAMDQARAISRLTGEFDLTHKQVAELLSKSRASVSNFLRLLQLNEDVKKLLEHGDLDMGHARCLLMLNASQQSQVAKLVVAKNLSVRETEALVTRVKSGAASKAEQSPQNALEPQYESKLQQLSSQLNTSVKLKPGKAGKGSLVIDYQDETSLNQLMDYLGRIATR